MGEQTHTRHGAPMNEMSVFIMGLPRVMQMKPGARCVLPFPCTLS